MAGNISDYLENETLDHVLGVGASSTPADTYLGLFTASPADDYSGSNNEVGTTGYTRQSCTFNAAAGGSTSLSADVTFPVAGDDWGDISHIAIFDSSNGSATNNMLWHGSLGTNKSIGSGDQAKVGSSDFTVSLD